MSTAQLGNLKDVRIRAAEWLERQERADWSEHDRAELDAWLAADAAHAVAYWRVEVAWQRTARLAALRPSAPSSISSHRRLWSVAAKSVAGFALVGVVGAGLFFGTRDPGQQIYATDVGGRKTLSLPDGSQIEINTNTVLRISKSDNRRVWLDRGEAYFQIIHDPKHPFVVDVGAAPYHRPWNKIRRSAGRRSF